MHPNWQLFAGTDLCRGGGAWGERERPKNIPEGDAFLLSFGGPEGLGRHQAGEEGRGKCSVAAKCCGSGK